MKLFKKRLYQLKSGLIPSAVGNRCEILFNAAQPARLAKGGTWSYGGSYQQVNFGRAGPCLGSYEVTTAKAKLSVRCEALNTNNVTVIAAVEKRQAGNIMVISQRGGGQAFNVSSTNMNLVQWNVTDNVVAGRSVEGLCVVAVRKRSSDNEIQYYLNGIPYGSITGRVTVSTTAINAGIGCGAGSGAQTANFSLANGLFIYGVAVLPVPDDALCTVVRTVEDFYNTFFVSPYSPLAGMDNLNMPLTGGGR